jgi:protein-S-isoprenylcysteine O-methyltransferase Ste14
VSRTFAVVRTLLIGTLFLSIWLYWLPLWFAHIRHVPLAPQNQWAWPIFGLGFALSFWCAMEFALRGRGTPAPFDPPRRLVITGLYRWVRNPIYVGMAIMLIGEALLLPQI